MCTCAPFCVRVRAHIVMSPVLHAVVACLTHIRAARNQKNNALQTEQKRPRDVPSRYVDDRDIAARCVPSMTTRNDDHAP